MKEVIQKLEEFKENIVSGEYIFANHSWNDFINLLDHHIRESTFYWTVDFIEKVENVSKDIKEFYIVDKLLSLSILNDSSIVSFLKIEFNYYRNMNNRIDIEAAINRNPDIPIFHKTFSVFLLENDELELAIDEAIIAMRLSVQESFPFDEDLTKKQAAVNYYTKNSINLVLASLIKMFNSEKYGHEVAFRKLESIIANRSFFDFSVDSHNSLVLMKQSFSLMIEQKKQVDNQMKTIENLFHEKMNEFKDMKFKAYLDTIPTLTIVVSILTFVFTTTQISLKLKDFSEALLLISFLSLTLVVVPILAYIGYYKKNLNYFVSSLLFLILILFVFCAMETIRL